ncbi:signal transduction histidine kinase [Flavobacterium arsenatis]|uniref:histidine kinase n=1 Tax=Flavobacterium arsenatis TaxID=1484332 RepID=A0ABU1TKT2_9FLAO|nr:tetratricopeptide repeat-containing sensor histidine kinase [Flavobacterium arsenatis]MDR6966584.1 signal transduction histidine kinase [Flavobacterium arsenatis]
MKKIVLLYLLFSFGIFAQETDVKKQQKIDSLLNVVKTTRIDSVKIRSLIKLEYCYRFTDFQKGLDYAHEALQLSKKIKWTKGLTICYNNIGNSYLDRGKHSEALDYYLKSLEYSENLLNFRHITLMNISNIYLREGNFSLAQKYIDESYKIAVKANDIETLAYCYYQMGLIARDQNKKKQAKDFFEKSLKIFKERKDVFQIAELTNFLAEVTPDYKLKLDYLLESKSIWDSIAPDYVSAVNNSIILSTAYLELYKDDGLRKKFSRKAKSELLSDAEKMLKKAVDYSKLSDTRQNLMDAYGRLSDLYALKNQPNEAHLYLVKHYNLRDSIFSQESKNKIAKLESQKEIELRDKEIQLNKLMLETKEKQKWFYIGGIFLLATIGVLLFYQSSNRRKTNEKLKVLNSDLDQANKTKTRFFSILNHDLRAPVSNLIHFLHLQKENPELLNEEIKKRLENKTITGAENLLTSMEDLLLWSKGQMENFMPQPKKLSIAKLFEDTEKHFSSEEKTIIVFENPSNIELISDENYLKTIIRNLTGNAIKALEKTTNPTIVWKAWKENEKIYLSVSDNGPGINQDQFKALYDDKEVIGIKSGLGLHLIRDLAKSINCEISVTSEPTQGTIFTLKFDQ